MKAFTTLNKLRQISPRLSGWTKLLNELGKPASDDDPLSLECVFEINGIDDAILAIQTVDRHEKPARLFACDCVESFLPLFEDRNATDMRPRNAIEVARRFASNHATLNELIEAGKIAAEAADDVWPDISADYAHLVWEATQPDAFDAAMFASKSGAENIPELFRKHFCTE